MKENVFGELDTPILEHHRHCIVECECWQLFNSTLTSIPSLKLDIMSTYRAGLRNNWSSMRETTSI